MSLSNRGPPIKAIGLVEGGASPTLLDRICLPEAEPCQVFVVRIRVFVKNQAQESIIREYCQQNLPDDKFGSQYLIRHLVDTVRATMNDIRTKSIERNYLLISLNAFRGIVRVKKPSRPCSKLVTHFSRFFAEKCLKGRDERDEPVRIWQHRRVREKLYGPN